MWEAASDQGDVVGSGDFRRQREVLSGQRTNQSKPSLGMTFACRSPYLTTTEFATVSPSSVACEQAPSEGGKKFRRSKA